MDNFDIVKFHKDFNKLKDIVLKDDLKGSGKKKKKNKNLVKELGDILGLKK